MYSSTVYAYNYMYLLITCTMLLKLNMYQMYFKKTLKDLKYIYHIYHIYACDMYLLICLYITPPLYTYMYVCMCTTVPATLFQEVLSEES